ncbi:MAG TPA: rhodanese-like domain-containing protein [Dermatophilaceae bacterium]|nr:rhodanese-like domain-containing protein [Dermatophilaceae bacterium]
MQMHPTRSWSRRIAAAVLAISAMGAIPVLSACSSDTPPSSSASPATGQHIAASDFSTAMKAPGTIVLDVRTPTEFAGGHLPQAQNIDIEAADFATRIAALVKNATYAVYCRSGNRSGTALEQMAAAGFTHVYDLADGIVAWQNMGGPLSTS